METQAYPPEVQELAKALRPILQAGLPVDPNFDDERLLGLRGVHARSIDPDAATSRIKALDGLLRSLLAHYPDDTLGEAARVIFGLTPGTRGATVTARREVAARETSYDQDHFRKKIEPKILRQLAWQLHRDSQNYVSRGRVAPPRLEPSGDTPIISKGDVSSREANEHQELLSRLWAKVYELRAEILHVERLKKWPYDETEDDLSRQQLDKALDARAGAVTAVRSLIQSYIDLYGESITHGEGEFSADALLRLAGWNEQLDSRS